MQDYGKPMRILNSVWEAGSNSRNEDEAFHAPRRALRKRRKETRSYDMPDSGCGSNLSQANCESFRNCLWQSNRCKFSSTNSTRVLFIGNSLTIRNDLPDMFASMSSNAGNPVVVRMEALAGRTFQYHASATATSTAMEEFDDWDAIVLQEQSSFFSYPTWKYVSTSIPYARTLYEMARERSTRVILFQTWAYRGGNPSYLTGLNDDFFSMQDRISSGYNYASDALQELRRDTTDAAIVVAPVGESFRSVFAGYQTKLYELDWKHPQPLGTYLAASVFYATIFQQSPVKINYRPKGISKSDSKAMRAAAADIALG